MANLTASKLKLKPGQAPGTSVSPRGDVVEFYFANGDEGVYWVSISDIIRAMRLLAMILMLPMAAFAVAVTPLPQGEYADTEVSTNIAFAVERPAMTRIEFTVALDATPTNNVEVAIGTDANSDGNLAVEEAACTFGYDCGRWFKREGELFDCSIVRLNAEGRIEKTFVLKKRQLDTAWNLVKVTRRGCGATCELVEAKGRKPGLKLEVR